MREQPETSGRDFLTKGDIVAVTRFFSGLSGSFMAQALNRCAAFDFDAGKIIPQPREGNLIVYILSDGEITQRTRDAKGKPWALRPITGPGQIVIVPFDTAEHFESIATTASRVVLLPNDLLLQAIDLMDGQQRLRLVATMCGAFWSHTIEHAGRLHLTKDALALVLKCFEASTRSLTVDEITLRSSAAPRTVENVLTALKRDRLIVPSQDGRLALVRDPMVIIVDCLRTASDALTVFELSRQCRLTTTMVRSSLRCLKRDQRLAEAASGKYDLRATVSTAPPVSPKRGLLGDALRSYQDRLAIYLLHLFCDVGEDHRPRLKELSSDLVRAVEEATKGSRIFRFSSARATLASGKESGMCVLLEKSADVYAVLPGRDALIRYMKRGDVVWARWIATEKRPLFVRSEQKDAVVGWLPASAVEAIVGEATTDELMRLMANYGSRMSEMLFDVGERVRAPLSGRVALAMLDRAQKDRRCTATEPEMQGGRRDPLPRGYIKDFTGAASRSIPRALAKVRPTLPDDTDPPGRRVISRASLES